MAGTTVATWVKVKNSKGLTSRPISHKYEGGASFEPGQVITQSEYQKLKSEGNQKREETKTGNKEAKTNKPAKESYDISVKEMAIRRQEAEKTRDGKKALKVMDAFRQKKENQLSELVDYNPKKISVTLRKGGDEVTYVGTLSGNFYEVKRERSQYKNQFEGGNAIANKPKRVKTPEQVSAQSARIVEKIRGRIETLKDKRGQSIDRKDQLEQQLKEGKSKVTTNKKLKSSSEYSDMIKSKKALDREIASAVSGNSASQYVKRQKMNKKQIQELNDKINEEYGKAFEYDARIKQLQKLGQNVSSKIY